MRILFDLSVARYIERVMWHPTQKFRRTAAGLEMTMEVAGTTELVPWVLGFGERARVIEPVSLREVLASELVQAASRYQSRLQ